MSLRFLLTSLRSIVLAGALMAGIAEKGYFGDEPSLAAPASSYAGPQKAVGTPAIVAVPGSRASTYATPVAVVEPGDELSFVNIEPFTHDVRSVAMGPDDTPWCNPPDPNEPQHRVRNPRRFPIGKCPLLWSLPISMTVGAVETKVYGTKNLKSGKTVEFYCTVFPNMRGTVIVR